MSELARRVIFAVIAAPLAVWIIWLGGAALATLLGAVGAIGLWELFRMARAKGVNPLSAVGLPLAALLPIVVHAAHLDVVRIPVSAAVLAVLLTLVVAMIARGADGGPLGASAITVFGVLYTSATLAFGYALRHHPFALDSAAAGTALVALPLLLTWGTDVGAFFVGRAVGGRKLWPSVSPGKTVSGAVGGLLVAVLVVWALVRFLLVPYANLAMTPVGIVAFAVIVSVAGQLGDLVESLLKREAGVKDSSHLIPGHGGVLDRFDSLFFTIPTAYLLLPSFLVPVIR